MTIFHGLCARVLFPLKISVTNLVGHKETRICMYVECNHAPGPSVLGSSDSRCTDRFRVKCQHPNSQPPHTSNSV